MSQLGEIEHIVVVMLENRSFDQMLGFLYAGSGNRSPSVNSSTGSPARSRTSTSRARR
jgi:phospholipase C